MHAGCFCLICEQTYSFKHSLLRVVKTVFLSIAELSVGAIKLQKVSKVHASLPETTRDPRDRAGMGCRRKKRNAARKKAKKIKLKK